MKTCCRCKVAQDLDQFYKDRQTADGLGRRCRSCKLELNAAYQKANPEKNAASTRRYQARHPERAKAAFDAWKVKNPGWSARNNRRWREANPDKAKRHYRENPEMYRERNLRRRARKLAATIGTVDLEALWLKNEGRCQLCGEPIDRTLRFPDPMSASVDHIVPLAKGGTHEQSNLQWTHLVENLRKGATVPNPSPLEEASQYADYLS